jgi:hypothetical protein
LYHCSAGEWANKHRDSKTACGLPGDAKYRVKDGSSASVDAMMDAYKAAGKPQCADNPIGELAYSHFMVGTHENQSSISISGCLSIVRLCDILTE